MMHLENMGKQKMIFQPEILYEDADLVAVKKPAGWLSQPGQGEAEGMPDMYSWLCEREKDKREAEASCQNRENGREKEKTARSAGGQDTPPYIGVVHRLDRGVGGVILFAKTKHAAAVLSEAVQNRTMCKQYLCVVSGTLAEPMGEYRDFLYRDAKQNKVYVVDRMRSGVKEAVLWYHVLETVQIHTLDGNGYDTYSLLLITLGTGRSHQIRAQLSHHGTPIVGDGKYGGHRVAVQNVESEIGMQAGEIALFSHRMAFLHPMRVPIKQKKKHAVGADGKTKKVSQAPYRQQIVVSALPAQTVPQNNGNMELKILPWGWFSFDFTSNTEIYKEKTVELTEDSHFRP
ncbi:MAG: RluA family pseudouridine synthase [Clostridia bacterium]|nr:RluA family pseudouridine synthase [Clostridia bacterium]